MLNILKEFTKTKRFVYLSLVSLLTLFSLALNTAFSAFTNRSETAITNIKVAGMEYALHINGVPGTTITATKNDTTKSNISVTSLNNRDSKYELIYKVCLDQACTNIVQKPEDLNIEYSSKTIDSISGAITSTGNKNIRIIVINNTSTTYYVKLDINAGYMHNTLALQNLITAEYNEEDIIIAATIDGETSTTFPTTNEYAATVTCETNDGPSSATGTVMWNGLKWKVNITGVDTGRTICNVEFYVPLIDKILAQGGGASAIEGKGTPDFSVINGTSGLYAAEDEYDGMSYYYRGKKSELNNNIIWGGFQWKIVRINGDDSIRLVYNGTEAQFNTNGYANDTGTTTQIGTSVFNSNRDDAKYVGYMYGGANGTASTMRNGSTSVAATYNETSNTIKDIIDNWYENNISGKPFEVDVVDNLFCNDRRLANEVGGTNSGPGYGNTGLTTYYAARHRLYTEKSPTLECGLKNDRFTKSDTTLGNGALTYPVGLLSADEAAMAGLVYDIRNSTNYLYTNNAYWLFSPYYFLRSSGYAAAFYVDSEGYLNPYNVPFSSGVRPAVSINSKTRVTGSGSNVDPYKVV